VKVFRSLRVRLLALIGLLLLVTLAGFGYVAWRRESAARIAAIDRELAERLNLLFGGYRPRMGERLEDVSEPRFSPRARQLFANEGGEPFYYRVWLSDGREQGHSDRAPEVALPPQTGVARQFRIRGDFRELVQFTATGRCFVVGRSMQRDRIAMLEDAALLATAGMGVLLLGLAFAWWIAARVTQPLVEISRTAKQIAAGDLSQRVNLAETEDELGDVANVLNETFARLEAAFARQKQFTADASHELRTPVALILTHAQGALLHEQSPEDYREALADCVQAAQRMKALIEALLDLARFDADADSARLTQVITNLLTNAIHFTPAEGTVTVRTHQDGSAQFIVSDTGPGIAPEQLQHIFERFRRADASRTRATGGTGLGLAICKAIAEAHGGSITVESELAKGSTFTVLLPATLPVALAQF
jgi:two-component system OmpR family sensor kinase